MPETKNTPVPYYRFRTHTAYPDLDEVIAVREDDAPSRPLPDDYSDFVWQFAPDHETARAQHFEKLDLCMFIANLGHEQDPAIKDYGTY